jgi:hypothetical protein
LLCIPCGIHLLRHDRLAKEDNVRKVLVLLLAFVLLAIIGCQTRAKESGKSSAQSDLVAELLKNDILENTSNTNVAISSNYAVTEPIISMSNVSNLVPVETEVGVKTVLSAKNAPGKVEKTINDKPIVADSTGNTVISVKRGSWVKIGDDSIGQTLSPRKSLKMTFAVFSDLRNAKHVDFFVYAVPRNSEVNWSDYYLIGLGRNFDVINSQCQYTHYWNGINIDGNYITEGRYNIYIFFKVKDAMGNVLYKEGRYWGRSQDFYVRLK